MEGPADHDLMARVARGDQLAFRLLSRRHARAALALARRIVGNDAIAEELVQEAFLRVWVNAPRWRPQAAFRTWLYRIVINLCLNETRRPHALPLSVALSFGGVISMYPPRNGPSIRSFAPLV